MAKTEVVNSKIHISLLAIVFMSGYGKRESMECWRSSQKAAKMAFILALW
jgi:hypothetical protein